MEKGIQKKKHKSFNFFTFKSQYQRKFCYPSLF